MKESYSLQHISVIRKLAYSTMGVGLAVCSLGATEAVVESVPQGLLLMAESIVPVSLGAITVAVDKKRDKEEELYRKRRENFVNSPLSFHERMALEDNPNIIEGEYRVIEPNNQKLLE